MPIDLSPFGFTATENVAYHALLELGPSSAYSVARRLTIARANAYQALDGLVAKGAASLVASAPRRYRATQPRTLLTQLSNTQAGKLDRLERQIASEAGDGERPVVWLTGTRAVLDAANRAVLRSSVPVQCLGTADAIESLAPAIRAGRAAGKPVSIWLAGAKGASPISDAGEVPAERLAGLFSTVPLLLLGEAALVAEQTSTGSWSGYWGQDPLFVGLVASAVTALTK
jgi:sugar-specific transcriptional regulator TrmB